MISIGRGIRWYNKYQDEVDFCVKYCFDFLQLWYKDGKIQINNFPEPKIRYIKDIGFPVILHAVFILEDFKIYGERLLDMVSFLESKEVIIHPICVKTSIDNNTEYTLAKHARIFSQKARARGITWYLENNSVMDVFHYKKEDLEIVFQSDTYVEQCLDIAHIDNYRHLAEIIGVKFPKCLHVAGKHFDVPHEHLPLMQGDIDYQFAFQKYLNGYDGKIILEIDGTDEDLIRSKQIIEDAVLHT